MWRKCVHSWESRVECDGRGRSRVKCRVPCGFERQNRRGVLGWGTVVLRSDESAGFVSALWRDTKGTFALSTVGWWRQNP